MALHISGYLFRMSGYTDRYIYRYTASPLSGYLYIPLFSYLYI